MWDLPRPGLEPVSPALAGRFLTTGPPGKPYAILHNELEHPRNLVSVGAGVLKPLSQYSLWILRDDYTPSTFIKFLVFD